MGIHSNRAHPAPGARTLQRHTGFAFAALALLAAALNYFQLTHFIGNAPLDALLSAFVGLLLVFALLLYWTAIGAPSIARPAQALICIAIGIGNAIDAESGNLTSALFLGIAFLLLLEYGYLTRGALWKYSALAAAFIIPYAVNLVVLKSLPLYGLLTSVLGVATVVYIGAVVSYVHFQRHKRREQELEQAVQERTATLEARIQETERLKSELEHSLQEKELLLKEVHHRTKNNLQLVSSVLNLENRRIKDPAAVAALTDGIHRVKALALAHEHLYGSDDLQHVDLETYTRALLDDISKSLGATLLRLEVAFLDSIPVDLDFAIPFGLILNELVSNAAKHASPDGAEITLKVQVERVGSTLRLTVQDDGPGVSEDIDLGSPTSMGVQLIVGLTHQLDGEVSVNSDGGTRWDIAFQMHHHTSAA